MLKNNIKLPFIFAYSTKTSLFISKKFIVFFVLVCMLTNGFASGINNVNKYSFVVILASISKNAAVQLLNKCGSSMLAVSNKICVDIIKIILPSVAQNSQTKKEKESKQENKSNDYAVVSNIQITGKRVLQSELNEKPTFCTSVFSYELFSRYGKLKSLLFDLSGIILLLFLVFIAAIKKRKGICSILSINNIVWKRRVPA